MSVTLVVGGQYGSEGKGKVTLDFAKKMKVDIAVKVGGMNSGHTAYRDNIKYVFKTLPTPALLDNVTLVIPSGAYFSLNNLLKEIDMVNLSKERLIIDPYSVIITEQDIISEKELGLVDQIGSTGSGTGSSIVNRVLRNNKTVFAKDIQQLRAYITDTKVYLRKAIDSNKKIIIEGTQGFGLSLLHSNNYPYVTSRDTCASSILSEVGLSPFDVTDIILTIRSFPIRVAGNSGELKFETTWKKIAENFELNRDITEYTTVTNKVRRVGKFDPTVVLEAILVNRPSIIVLNHLDYLSSKIESVKDLPKEVNEFIEKVEHDIGKKIDFIGIDPYQCYKR